MNIGDQVRSLHGTDEGIVVQFLPKNIVEIEIEDGFRIPIHQSELVVVAHQKRNESIETHTENTIKPKAQKGFFLAIENINNKLLPYLINNTDRELVGVVHLHTKRTYQGVSSFKLAPRDFVKLNTSWELNEIGKKTQLRIAYLPFHKNENPVEEVVSLVNLPDHKILKKATTSAPIIDKEAIIFQIDESPNEITLEDIDSSFGNTETDFSKNSAKNIKKKDSTIDLHSEALGLSTFDYNENEILDVQIDAFEKALDQAILNQQDHITFIHGVGNGTLRYKIQKVLSEHPHVKFYEDADKTKFGYGATRATL